MNNLKIGGFRVEDWNRRIARFMGWKKADYPHPLTGWTAWIVPGQKHPAAGVPEYHADPAALLRVVEKITDDLPSRDHAWTMNIDFEAQVTREEFEGCGTPTFEGPDRIIKAYYAAVCRWLQAQEGGGA